MLLPSFDAAPRVWKIEDVLRPGMTHREARAAAIGECLRRLMTLLRRELARTGRPAETLLETLATLDLRRLEQAIDALMPNFMQTVSRLAVDRLAPASSNPLSQKEH